MISKTESNYIIKVLGRQYSGKIAAHLIKKKMKNASGGTLSSETIRQIVGGHRENDAVLSEIMKFVSQTAKSKAAAISKRRSLLK